MAAIDAQHWTKHIYRVLPLYAALCLSWCQSPRLAAAQSFTFGSLDDPREQFERLWWRQQNVLDVMGGLSLIGPQWRGASEVAFNVVTPRFSGRLLGTLRGGVYGDYRADTDELYDLLRLVQFARINPLPRSTFYARIGSVQRLRLGMGHLVNFFRSDAAWDERTVGLEFLQQGRFLDISGFSDDVRFDGLVGGQITLKPFARLQGSQIASLRIGVGYVRDLNTDIPNKRRIEGYSGDVSLIAIHSGDLRFLPYVSYAAYTNYGSGVGLGAEIAHPNFIDLARFAFRIGVFYNSRDFVPGYVGSFYQVSNPRARIANSDDFLSDQPNENLEGIALQDALGAYDLVTEMRLVVLDRFEFWYYFQRNFSIQSLDVFHLRLFIETRTRIRMDVGIDRGGLNGFFSLFNALGDQTSLILNTDYRLADPFILFIKARYTYERTNDSEDGSRRYIVQRRFEPMLGLRLRL